jgi:serine protease Do
MRWRWGIRLAGAAVWLGAVGALAGEPAPSKLPLAARPAIGPLSPAEIAAHAQPAVVTVRAGDGFGSGFVAGNGRVATSLHVISAGTPVIVVVPGGREVRDLTVVATDADSDLAVLGVPGAIGPPLPLGDSDAARPGDRVVAIGHPFGLDHTVSDGLLSAVRKLPAGLSLLQISAPISPGSSGGPLFNDRGEVIGVATLASVAGQNLNFCVPINLLKPLLAAKGGTPVAAWKRPHDRSGLRAGVERRPVSVLAGCAAPELATFRDRINEAISVGAPLYNQGQHEACYRVYDSTARELVRRGEHCPGAAHILDEGLARADRAAAATPKAWALRDAFDALLDVVERREEGAAEGPPRRILPHPPPRAVPHHPVALLRDCSDEDIDKLRDTIGSAINVGAPLYNDGQFDACFRIYATTSEALQQTLVGCPGAKRALAAGLHEAAGRSDAIAKAWALRDAFDGLLDVIARVALR